MPAWTAFAAVAGVVTFLLLLSSHATSQRFVRSDASVRDADGRVDDDEPECVDDESPLEGGVTPDDESSGEGAVDEPGSSAAVPRGGREAVAARELDGLDSGLSQPLLLANVALSQGAFGLVLVVAAVAGDVPWSALGLGAADASALAVGLGVALGVVLYGANEVGSAVAAAAGLGSGDALRELLAPESTTGWLLLLGGVLPIVAGFEELLFRGVLVGALAVGFDASPWLLAVASSVLFGLGHGAQGRVGVLATATLGLVLAAAFVVSGSLLLVVVAHYLVNALEFVVHEGLDGEPTL